MIRAYFVAITTKYDYVVIATTYEEKEYIQTNDISSYKDNEDFVILEANNKNEVLDKLKNEFNKLSSVWTKYRYHYTLENFLKNYDLSIKQYMQIKKLFS